VVAAIALRPRCLQEHATQYYILQSLIKAGFDNIKCTNPDVEKASYLRSLNSTRYLSCFLAAELDLQDCCTPSCHVHLCSGCLLETVDSIVSLKQLYDLTTGIEVRRRS